MATKSKKPAKPRKSKARGGKRYQTNEQKENAAAYLNGAEPGSRGGRIPVSGESSEAPF